MNFKKWLNEQRAVYDPRKKVDWWGAPKSYIVKQLDPIMKKKKKKKKKK